LGEELPALTRGLLCLSLAANFGGGGGSGGGGSGGGGGGGGFAALIGFPSSPSSTFLFRHLLWRGNFLRPLPSPGKSLSLVFALS